METTNKFFWHEPDTTMSVNAFLPFTNSASFNVLSEDPLPAGQLINGNGVQITITNGINIGGVVQNLDVTFTDIGDVAAAVPEPSTLSYMILAALVSAMVFRRKLGTPLRRGC
jgi:hypothetical protein